MTGNVVVFRCAFEYYCYSYSFLANYESSLINTGRRHGFWLIRVMQLQTIDMINPSEDFLIPENFPRISIVIPFESKMNTKAGMKRILSAATAIEEKELMKNYSEDQATLVIKKLHILLANLKGNTHNKSIAIFVSPLAAKVFYFNHSARVMSNYRAF